MVIWTGVYRGFDDLMEKNGGMTPFSDPNFNLNEGKTLVDELGVAHNIWWSSKMLPNWNSPEIACWAQSIGSIVDVSSWLSHYKAGMSSSWFLYLEFMVHIFAVGGIYDFKQNEVCWSRQFARFEFVCLLSRCASAFVIATLLLSKRVSIPALSVDFRLENSQECFM